jgi:hypothetical protein
LFNQGGLGGNFRNRINQIAEKFRQMGATSPATAKTIQELDLPPRFEEAMRRRLGRTGIFVEFNGRYYLDEARLTQFAQGGFHPQGRAWQGGQMGKRRTLQDRRFALRIARIVIGILILALIFANFFFLHSFYVWIVTGVLFLLAIIISVMQLYYMTRIRRMRSTTNFP